MKLWPLICRNCLCNCVCFSSGESRTVRVCGSDTAARQSVAQLARELGFAAVESGGLRQARDLERAQRVVCAEWIKPMIVFGGMMVLWTVYIYLRYFVLRKTGYTWHRFPTNVMNKVCTLTQFSWFFIFLYFIWL